MSHYHNCDICQEDYLCDLSDQECTIDNDIDEIYCPECSAEMDFPEESEDHEEMDEYYPSDSEEKDKEEL